MSSQNNKHAQYTRQEIIAHCKKWLAANRNSDILALLSDHIVATDETDILTYPIETQDWITKELEPELWAVVEAADKVDHNHRNSSAWKYLFDVVETIVSKYNNIPNSNAISGAFMLRDYEYTENWRLLDQALEQFIDLPERLSLVGFKALSPDSFLWQIFDGHTTYYLYAEDYVPSLEHVKQQISNFYQTDIEFEFVPPKKTIAFEDSIPNRAAATYKPPEDVYELAKYAGLSGYDFVFLLRQYA